MEKETEKKNDAVVTPEEKVEVKDAPKEAEATTTAPATEGAEKTAAPAPAAPARPKHVRNERPKRTPRRGGPRRGGERAKPEFDNKIISIRRVVRVVSGGRRFSFSVTIVAGNKKGRVGVGIGKAGDTALAIEKALRDAKKHMITLKLTDTMSLPHEVQARFSSSDIMMMPAPGKGLVAGGAVRTVLDLGGIKDVSAKILSRSKNRLNNARATLVALKEFAA